MLIASIVALVAGSSDCFNAYDDTNCDAWAGAGECLANPKFMRSHCSRSCDSCGWMDTYCDARNNGPAKTEGDIARTFERAIHLPGLNPTVHSVDPYVITFDDFITNEEADAFLSTITNFERSLAGDIVSPVRTSEQARV